MEFYFHLIKLSHIDFEAETNRDISLIRDELREHLKNTPKVIVAQKPDVEPNKSSPSSSSSASSSSESDSSASDSDSSDSSSEASSEESDSSSSSSQSSASGMETHL